MKVKDLSAKMVISTGRMRPSWLCVRELNSLQNAMMLIPWGPNAVPTGGAGFARPAGIWSLTNPTTFFAIASPLRYAGEERIQRSEERNNGRVQGSGFRVEPETFILPWSLKAHASGIFHVSAVGPQTLPRCDSGLPRSD